MALAALLALHAPAALAKPSCSVTALNMLRVPGVRVTKVHETKAPPFAAPDAAPARCVIEGTFETRGDGAPPGSAHFQMWLPDGWRQRFILMGIGGNGGTLESSTNALDQRNALRKGYAMLVQDGGHTGDGESAAWVLKSDGSRDTAKIADFQYRAAHLAAETGKALARAYYGAPVRHAYFDGCSTGGRMAMMEAERYPTDFDGVIAGDPLMDYSGTLLRASVMKAMRAHPDGWLSPETLSALQSRITQSCAGPDRLEGPSCSVTPQDLACRPGAGGTCLTPDQVPVVEAFTGALRAPDGRVLYPGWPITALSGYGGAASWVFGLKPPDWTHPEAPWAQYSHATPYGWTYTAQSVTYWLGMGERKTPLTLDVNPATGEVGAELLTAMDQAFGPAETKDPRKLLPFIQQRRKLILYHGTADPAIPAARTTMFYDRLQALLHGGAAENVRLFLVPGMRHCAGGGGPDQFDTLSALEDWVERGEPPDTIMATPHGSYPGVHNLALCPYPEWARLSGADAANWTCQ